MAVTAELIENLARRTRERKLDWRPLSSGGFIANIGPNSITIDQPGPKGIYVLRITNDKNMVIETVGTLETGDDNLGIIYENARRQAFQVDETLESIKSALEKL